MSSKPDLTVIKNIFDTIPEVITREICEPLINTNALKIERIISKGHVSPQTGWYDQDKNEWVIVLKGAATLLFENNSSVQMKTGDYINIPAHKKHKVEWTDPETETVWLTVHY